MEQIHSIVTSVISLRSIEIPDGYETFIFLAALILVVWTTASEYYRVNRETEREEPAADTSAGNKRPKKKTPRKPKKKSETKKKSKKSDNEKKSDSEMNTDGEEISATEKSDAGSDKKKSNGASTRSPKYSTRKVKKEKASKAEKMEKDKYCY